MKLTLLILILFLIKPIFANQRLSQEANLLTVIDGGKSYQKKKHRHKTSIRVNKKTFSFLGIKNTLNIRKAKKRTKSGAILMAVLTGPIGGHRLYLGCDPYIPIFYALTLGGGLGVLPAIDIVIIALSKDLSPYEDNHNIIMWGHKLIGTD